jgi:hypothetical protein
VSPSMLSKFNTALQLVLMGSCLVGDVYGFLGHPVMDVLRVSVGFTTVISTIDYLFFNSPKKIR